MALLSNPEVIFLKESNAADEYLNQLLELQKNVQSPVLDKEIAVVRAGIAGEKNIEFELKNSGMDLVVLHDLYMEAPNGNGAQIDFVVVTHYVTVFIECKNLIGNIEINSRDEFIRTFKVGSRSYREGIYSPVTQNERHLEVFKECRNANHNLIFRASLKHFFDYWNKSLVVLANPRTTINDRYAHKNIKDQVIRADQLVKTLKSKGFTHNISDRSSKKEMLAIGNVLLGLDKEHNAYDFSIIKEQIEDERKKQSGSMICPFCGGTLIERKGKYGRFLGCSNYPKCHYTRQLK